MEKKKNEQYIIPSIHFICCNQITPKIENHKIIEQNDTITTGIIIKEKSEPTIPIINNTSKNEIEKKISALSLSSIKTKRELLEIQKKYTKDEKDLPCELFTEADMQTQWNKFAQRLSEKGQKIMSTYMQINVPKLSGTTIKLELPNEGSKVDFDNEKHNLLIYLRKKLHNHNITIEVIVNEIIETKYSFTAQEKYNRLRDINQNLEILRKTFDLDF